MILRSKLLTALLIGPPLITLPLACSGDDGRDGVQGPPGPSTINASTASTEFLEELDIVTAITGVTIASPPKVTFTMSSAAGVPIIGLVPLLGQEQPLRPLHDHQAGSRRCR